MKRDKNINQPQEERIIKISKKDQFLQINFSLIIDLLKLKKISQNKCYFLLAFTFVNMYVTNMHTYVEQLNIHYPELPKNDMVSLIEDTMFKYLDVQQILNLYDYVYSFVFFLAILFVISMSILYIIGFYAKKNHPDRKPRKHFYGRWFVNMTELFSWILFFPFVIIFLQFINCNQSIFNMSCEMGVLRFLTMFFAIIGLILTIVNEWLLNLFFQNGFSVKKDSFNCENHIFLVFFNSFRFSVGVIACVKVENYAWFIFYLLYNVLTSGALLLNIYFGQGFIAFYNKGVRTIFIYCLVGYFSQSLGLITDEICRTLEIYPDQEGTRSIVIIIAFVILMGFSNYGTIQHQQYKVLLRQNVANQNLGQLKLKACFLFNLVEQSVTSPYDSTFFKGMVQRHLANECIHDNKTTYCFCKFSKIGQDKIYDPKKKKYVLIDKFFLDQSQSILAKFMIQSWMEIYIQNNPNSFSAYIDYAEFLYHKLRNVPLAVQQIIFIENRFLFPIDKFRIFRLRHFIKKGNRKNNKESYKNRLEIESVIELEDQIENIKQICTQIILNNITFWESLEKNVINLNSLDQILQKSFDDIKLAKQKWISLMPYLDLKKKWKFYYAWFFLYILNKKVKQYLLEKFQGIQVNENDIFSEDMQNEVNEDEVQSVSSFKKLEDIDKIKIKKIEMVFDKKSCIFNVNGDHKGKIIKVNNAVLQIFGYNRVQIEKNTHITDIMPRSYAIHHPHIINNFAKTGISKSMYSQRKVFCLNSNGYVFPAWKFIKQYITLSGRAHYMALLRPSIATAGTKVHYAIINEDFNIDTMTLSLFQLLNIDPKEYQMQYVIPLLIVAPRLLQFTKFARFLDEQEMTFFGINQQKDNININLRQNVNTRPSILVGQPQRRQSQLMQNALGAMQNLNNPGTQTNAAVNGANNFAKQQQQMQNNKKFDDNKNLPPIKEEIKEKSDRQLKTIPELDNSTIRNYPSANRIQTTQPDEIDEKEEHQLPSSMNSSPKSNKLQINPKQIMNKALEKNEIENELNLYKNMEKKDEDESGDETPNLKNGFRKEEHAHTGFGFTAKSQKTLKADSDDDLSDIDLKKGEIPQEKHSSSEEELLDEDDEDGEGAKKGIKDKRLDKGEIIKFFLKIPQENLVQMCNQYMSRLNQALKKDNKTQGNDLTSHVSQQRNKTMYTGTLYEDGNGKKTLQKDKITYNIIKQLHKQFVYRKPCRIFKVEANMKINKFQTKNFQKEKIRILKLHSCEETTKTQTQMQKKAKIMGLYSKPQDPKQKDKKQSNKGSGNLGLNNLTGGALNNFTGNQKPSNAFMMGILNLQDDESIILNNKKDGTGYQIGQNIDIGQINLQTVHQDFINKQGARNFSLNFLDNIYIKEEENHKAKKKNSNINNIKWFIRYFFFSLLALNIFTFFFSPFQEFTVLKSQSFRVFQTKQTLLNIIESYNIVLDIIQVNNNFYEQDVFEQSNFKTEESYVSSYLKSKLIKFSEYFKLLNIDEDMKQTFFDSSIMKHDQYSKEIIEEQLQEQAQNGNIDIPVQDYGYSFSHYYMIQHYIYQLETINKIDDLSELTVDHNSVKYIRENIFPYINDILLTAEKNLLSQINETVDSIQQFLLIVIIVESIIIVVSFIILIYLIRSVCAAFQAIVEVFPTIDSYDIKKIKQYNQSLIESFTYITIKDDIYAGVIDDKNKERELQYINNLRQNRFNFDDQNDGNMNQQVRVNKKEIQQDKFLVKIKFQSYSYYIFFTLIVTILSGIFLYRVYNSTLDLSDMLENGQIFMNPVTYDISMLVAMKEKYIDQDNYKESFRPIIQETLDQFFTMDKDLFIEDLGVSNFDDVFNDLYLSNPCIELKNQINNTQQEAECQQVALGSLIHGLTSFNNYYANKIEDLLQSDEYNKFGDITKNQLFDFERAIEIVNILQIYLLETWSNDMQNYLTDSLVFLTIYISCMAVVLFIFYIVFSEQLLVGNFSQEYKYFRSIYKNFMPDKIIQKNKRIKFYLVMHDILMK